MGIGKKLMELAIKKGNKEGAKSLRLVQDCYNAISFSLYLSLGFEPKYSVVYMRGIPNFQPPFSLPHLLVRNMTLSDIPACTCIMTKMCGFNRAGELKHCVEKIEHGTEITTTPLVCEQIGIGVIAFTSGFFMDGFTLVPTQMHLHLMLQFAGSKCLGEEVVCLHVPYINNALLVQVLLKSGFKAAKLENLMAIGEYTKVTDGIYFPSLSF